jgi:tetratricopeptide (TPR) repeat protein
MSTRASHTILLAPYQRDRQNAWEHLALPENAYMVDCHRTHRGPFTGTGSLLRQIVPVIFAQSPELVQAHSIEILSLAPELQSLISVPVETLTSLAVPAERTRFYSRYRTLRLTHGLIDLLKGYLALGAFERLSLLFDQVQAADELDQEFLRELLRRADPATIHVTIGTSTETLPELLAKALATYAQPLRVEPRERASYTSHLQASGFSPAWQDWLLTHSLGFAGEYEPLQACLDLLATSSPTGSTFAEGMHALVAQTTEEQRATWSQAFIASDCTSDALLEGIAYHLAADADRRRWHDEQAEILAQHEEWSLRLGAIPYHREHGASPAEKGAEALQQALDYCINFGFYEATVDLGYRGRAVIDWQTQLQYYWTFTTKNTTSLAALERPEEAEALYDETRALTAEPLVHMQAAYATAMLYTRHHAEGKRDHQKAKAWINQAIAIASLIADPKERAFSVVFNRNGLALIEAHLKQPEEALQLVTAGLAKLDEELQPGEHLLHRSVLLYNRAQVYAGLGQLDLALADYTAVIEQDPHYSEYYFDRGNILRRLGRNEEALADYQSAISYSPPYPEAYYNRAGVFSVLGDEERALADYSYVIEIEPTNLDALVNRASMRYERGWYAEAREDVVCGLELDAQNAQLLCTLGLLEMAEEQYDSAFQALSAAIVQDPSLLAAWTNRAILAFEQGDQEAAIADLTQALVLEENATVRYNRGIAYQAQRRWQEAIEDFTQALALSEEDAQDILYQRSLCHQQLGNETQAQADLREHLALDASVSVQDLSQVTF